MITSLSCSQISEVSDSSLFNYSTISLEDTMNKQFSDQQVQIQIEKDDTTTNNTQNAIVTQAQTIDINTNKCNTKMSGNTEHFQCSTLSVSGLDSKNQNFQSTLSLIKQQETLLIQSQQQQQQENNQSAQQSKIFSRHSIENNISSKEIKEQYNSFKHKTEDSNVIQNNIPSSIIPQQSNTQMRKEVKQKSQNATEQETQNIVPCSKLDGLEIPPVSPHQDSNDTQFDNIQNKNGLNTNKKIQNLDSYEVLRTQNGTEQQTQNYVLCSNLAIANQIPSQEYSLSLSMRQNTKATSEQEMQHYTDYQQLKKMNETQIPDVKSIFDTRTQEYDEQTNQQIETDQLSQCGSYQESCKSQMSDCSDIDKYYQNSETQKVIEQLQTPLSNYDTQKKEQNNCQQIETGNKDETLSNPASHYNNTQDQIDIKNNRGQKQLECPTGHSLTQNLQQIVEEEYNDINSQFININTNFSQTQEEHCVSSSLSNHKKISQGFQYSDTELQQNIDTDNDEQYSDDEITEKQERIAKLNTSGFKPKIQIIKDLQNNFAQTINKQYEGVNFVVYHASLQNWSIIKKVLWNKIMEKNYGILNSRDLSNKNLLFYTVYYKKYKIIKKLLQFPNAKDQINIITKNNFSPFKYSILDNNYPVSQLLHQKGVDPNQKIQGQPLVMDLIQYANAEVVKNFITKFQPNFQIRNEEGQLPLQYFCTFRDSLYDSKCKYRYNIQQIEQIDNMYNILAVYQRKTDFNIEQKLK